MAFHGSLDESINKLVKRYSSLFTLPSHKKIISLLCLVCVAGGVLSILALDFSYNGCILGVLLGCILFILSVLSDLMINKIFMRQDLIFDLRRCGGLSLFSSILWIGFILLGALLSLVLKSPSVWIKLFLLGFCATAILRLVVFFTMSTVSHKHVFMSSWLQPLLWLVAVFWIWLPLGYGLPFTLYIFASLSIPIVVLAVFVFIFAIDQVGKKRLHVSTFSLFRAFLANWVEDLNAPLEGFFEKLGSVRDIDVSLLVFRAKGKDKIKAVIVVPSFHPGPFKNVGSSSLPFLIQSALERKLNCVVSVPHGLFGHEYNLSSQAQNRRVLEKILESASFSSFNGEASPLVRAQEGIASATCQTFGNCALFTLTLAPHTTEDLPQELGLFILKETKKRGLSTAFIVNAHNSINGILDMNKSTELLEKAALASLEKALSHKRAPFEIGAAKTIPNDFSVKNGMGPGGISTVVMKVGDQKIAYVIIDGNNMVTGLREKILSALKKMGIDDGEVLTTDTHVVSGVVLNSRGYHPVGEVMDHRKLLGYIKQTTLKALNDLEPAEVAWRTETISNVKVMGETQIKALSSVAEKATKRAKQVAIMLFPAVGALLTTLLVIL